MKKTTKYILIGLGIIIAFNIISNLFESEPEPLPDKYLKVETSRIKGHLGDCFEVVSKEYKVKSASFVRNLPILVDLIGFEPTTPTMRM